MFDVYILSKFFFGQIAAWLLFVGFMIIFRQYLKKKYRPSLYLAIAWFGFFFEAFFGSISLAFESGSGFELILLKISYTSLIPGFLGVLAVIDSISRDNIDPKRFTVLVFVLGANSIVIWLPLDANFISIPYYIVISIGFVISIANLFLYVQIYRKVPPYLKRLAFFSVIGAFFVAILYVTVNILETVLGRNFPPISRLFEATGALIQACVFSKYVQLFYVLPFKAQKLIVFDTSKGLSLFTHEWSKPDKFIDEDLFTSILHGMSMIVNESLDKGNVQEIKLEQGVLLISHDSTHPVASVLIASKSSRVLRDGLADFSHKVVEKFESNINNMEFPDNSQEIVDDLVKSCFPFIPQF